MVCHISINVPGTAARGALRREVERFDQPVSAAAARSCQQPEVRNCLLWCNCQCKRSCVRRDNHVPREAPFQAKFGNAEPLIPVTVFRIASGICRFRDTPGNALGSPVALLDVDHHPLALAQQRAGVRLEQQARHKIFEHRAVPGDQHRSTLDAP